jgi:hypothetical protein
VYFSRSSNNEWPNAKPADLKFPLMQPSSLSRLNHGLSGRNYRVPRSAARPSASAIHASLHRTRSNAQKYIPHTIRLTERLHTQLPFCRFFRKV